MIEAIAGFLLGGFLAANMGVSGFSVSFAPSYGSGILSRNKAVIAYSISVIAGGLLLGPRILETLLHKLSSSPISNLSGTMILISCALTMFVSNWLGVPQSTSFVTVAGFAGAAAYTSHVNLHIIGKIIGVAALFSVLSISLTIFINRFFYPPRPGNFFIYEKLLSNRGKFKRFIILHDIYAGFCVGTNNIANVVAPLIVFWRFPAIGLFVLVGFFFGLGAFFWGNKVLQSVSKEIVPVGEFSGSIVSFITATFVLIASSLGLPTPYVQFTTFSVLGVSAVKDGIRATMSKGIVKRIFIVWLLVPICTFMLSYGLHALWRVR
jgi:sulfate permease